MGRYEDALEHYRQALQLATARGDVHGAAGSLDHVALVLKWLGRYDEALRMSVESLVAHRRLGDVAGEALCLNNLAALHIAKQDYRSAGTYLRESLVLCDRDGLVGTRLYVLSNLTEVELKSGNPAAAEDCARRAIEAAEAVGNRSVVAWMKLQLTRFAVLRKELAIARTELAESLAITTAIAQRSLRIGSVGVFAEVLEAQGEVAAARQVLNFAATHPTTSAPDREELTARLALHAESGEGVAPWPSIELDELVHRIVVEADLSYAPLIAALGAR
jgi:tetratricopeptide (TPR) repeat protein